ncbi:winged helix-turn-helix domain-containing protein [Pleionea sp. CnH1-48]|uniref:winged helix-turn-helix domain-containing protein n=1 Tax=Pleionea sp. CnH1-48 TaxID=2954494 RepID=UPI002096E3C4|nr:winged helix-turn-helix domain-containing protein [Pleionea sp. CnH1-48]MCO7223881.1 winged helix-turn-helix domain-containing protein [Pleionea sp. CnH1-48]
MNTQLSCDAVDDSVFASFFVGSMQFVPLKNQVIINDKSLFIEARQMQVLYYLYQNAHTPVSLDELSDKVWSGKCVGNHAIYRVINKLRKLLQQQDEQAEWITTHPKKGYQLNLPSCSKDANKTFEEVEVEPLTPKTKKSQGLAQGVVAAFVCCLIVAVIYHKAFDSEFKKPVIIDVEQASNSSPMAFSLIESRKFNSADDAIVIEHSDALNFNGSNFSISARVKTNKAHATVVDKRDMEPPVTGFLFMIYEGRLLFQLGDAYAGWQNIFLPSSPNVADGHWHEIGVSVERHHNRPEIKLYLDGKVIYQTHQFSLQGGIDNKANLLIGRHQNENVAFIGEIEDLYLFKGRLGKQDLVKSNHSKL